MLDVRNKSLVSDPTYAVDIRTRVVRCNKQLAESCPVSRVTVEPLLKRHIILMHVLCFVSGEITSSPECSWREARTRILLMSARYFVLKMIASKLCVSSIQNNGLLAQNPYDIIL